MTKNLLEQAKELKSKRRSNFEITPEIIELALAWKRDEISIGQIEKVLNISVHNKIYAILARALKAHGKEPKEEKSPNKIVENNKVAHKPSIGKSPDTAPSKY